MIVIWDHIRSESKETEICSSLFFSTILCFQAICSSLTGVFAGRAMLKAAGVGNSEATAAAATINWIIRDGASMIGSCRYQINLYVAYMTYYIFN